MGTLVASSFRPAWWLPGPHLQTLWSSLARSRPDLRLERRRIELADGDFIDLAQGMGRGPRVLVIHGLEGDLQSHYAGTLLAALAGQGYCALFMHLRGCSGEPNRLSRGYHSGASEDLREVLTHLAGDQAGLPACNHHADPDHPRPGRSLHVSRQCPLRAGTGTRRHLGAQLPWRPCWFRRWQPALATGILAGRAYPGVSEGLKREG